MTAALDLDKPPAGNGRQRAALGEQWRINSCFCGQLSCKRKKGGTGYISLVYSSPSCTLNPDGVKKQSREKTKCIPTQEWGGESTFRTFAV